MLVVSKLEHIIKNINKFSLYAPINSKLFDAKSNIFDAIEMT